jgi:hypothetical protein
VRPYGVGGLVLGAEPTDQAVAFFFGPLGVEGDEAIEDDVVEVGFLPPFSSCGRSDYLESQGSYAKY